MTVTWVAAALLYVQAFFNGVAFSCLVDTGSTHTLLRQSAASTVPALSRPITSVSLVAANGSSFAGQLTTVASVKTKHLSWASVQVVIVPDELFSQTCLLGMNVLGQQPITVDLQTGELWPAIHR